jgi:hypothetical protein
MMVSMENKDKLNKSNFETVIDCNGRSDFHTAIVTFMRKIFGKDKAGSAYGHGFSQYDGVLVDAPVEEVRAAIVGRKWEHFVNVRRVDHQI